METYLFPEHKTEQFGADFDTNYKVLTLCSPDCPACSVKSFLDFLIKNYLFSRLVNGKARLAVPEEEWKQLCKSVFGGVNNDSI